MARAAPVMPLRLARRMCLSCGFDGRAIQNHSRDSTWVCPRCDSDLYARPPKSYAELEALSDSNPGSPMDDNLLRPAPRRSIVTRATTIIDASLRASTRTWIVAAALAALSLFAVGVWIGRTF